MGNRFLRFVMFLLLLVAGFLGFFYAIDEIITISLKPITAQIGEIRALVKSMANHPASGNVSQNAALEQKVAALDAHLTKFLQVIENGPRQQRPQPPQEDMNKVYAIDDAQSPILGNKNAPITIVEFLDIQCPFCLRFYPVVKDVVKAYPGKVRSIIKNFPLPFHPNALPAAKLALAANLQGKYFEMIDILLANAGDVSEEKVKGYAKELKLNYKKLMDDYKNKDAEWQKIIEEDKALAMRVDVRGTPSFYLNGKKTNARDLESFKAEIEKILSEKK